MANKKILVISGLDTPQERAVGRYAQFSTDQVAITVASLSELALTFIGNSMQAFYRGEKLENFQGIYISAFTSTEYSAQRSFANWEMLALIARYCRDHQIKIFDSAWDRDWWLEHKSFETYLYAQNNIPHIDTVCFLGSAWPAMASLVSSSYPKIAKSSFGNKGKQVWLCRDAAELQTTLASLADTVVLVQDFMANDGDIRVTVVNYQVRLAEKRVAVGDNFRNNISQGGQLTLATLDDATKQLAVQASRAMQYELAGVDLIFDQSKIQWVVMETNRVPELEPYAEGFSGDLRREFVDFLMQTIS